MHLLNPYSWRVDPVYPTPVNFSLHIFVFARPLSSSCMETLSTLHPKAANGPPWLTVPATKARRPKSADSSTKPLRSSPLTGPALNHSLVAFTAPSLTASNSEPTDHTTTPPHPKSFDSSSSTQPFPDHFRRSSYGSGIRGSGRPQSLSMPSTFDTGHATRTAIAKPEWEIDSLQNPIPARTPKSRPRPQTSSGVPSFRRPIPIVEEEADQIEIEPLSKDISNTSRNSSTNEFNHSQSTSHPRDNSWYTANPYDVTPRFSRLGLSASNVVMPLSAKEHRRLSSTTSSSGNTSPILRRLSILSPPSPKSPSKSPPKSPPIAPPPTAPTRVRLRPRSPPPQSLQPYTTQPLSRPISTMSSSETSSIASTSQRDTPTPISISISNFTSSPSLSRSMNSQDSLSTWYESCLPATPPECDEVLSTEHDGEECEGDKKEVAGGGGDGRVEESTGVGLHEHRDRDHDHDEIKYPDTTVRNDSDNDKTQPEQEMASKSTTIEQSPKTPIHSDVGNDSDNDQTRPGKELASKSTTLIQSDPQPQLPPSNPLSTQATLSNSPSQTTTLPKDIEKGRDSLQKTLVRVKLQSVDFDDFDAVQSVGMKTMSATPTTPIATAEVGPGLRPVVVGSENTLVDIPPLPIPTLKKKRSTFKSILKSFLKRW